MKITLAPKKTMAFSLTARARSIIEALAIRDGVTMSTALELALREIAKNHKLAVSPSDLRAEKSPNDVQHEQTNIS